MWAGARNLDERDEIGVGVVDKKVDENSPRLEVEPIICAEVRNLGLGLGQIHRQRHVIPCEQRIFQSYHILFHTTVFSKQRINKVQINSNV